MNELSAEKCNGEINFQKFDTFLRYILYICKHKAGVLLKNICVCVLI